MAAVPAAGKHAGAPARSSSGKSSDAPGVILELCGIEKSFGDTKVLDGLNLTIRRGEFITLLGPSGCGKTTTLRIIAGLETPDAGNVLIAGKDVTREEPNKRNVNTVFQNYALFPHMNVEANIGYSLRLKHVDKETVRRTVAEALDLVQLAGYEKRMPDELSGGQRQRVAIARAIVNRPAVLLLDEPLGALDLQLRRQMQIELKRLQVRLGVTFIYITHDQEEALNMSDRIAVMRYGRFEQVGTPSDVYDHPKTSYVASFVGSANVVKGTVRKVEGQLVTFQNEDGTGVVTAGAAVGEQLTVGQPITIAIRSELVDLAREINLVPGGGLTKEPNPTHSGYPTIPEELAREGNPVDEQGHLGQPKSGLDGSTADGMRTIESGGLRGIVKEKQFAGGMLRIVVSLQSGNEITASRHGIDSPLAPGDQVVVTWQPDRAVAVDLDGAAGTQNSGDQNGTYKMSAGSSCSPSPSADRHDGDDNILPAARATPGIGSPERPASPGGNP